MKYFQLNILILFVFIGFIACKNADEIQGERKALPLKSFQVDIHQPAGSLEMDSSFYIGRPWDLAIVGDAQCECIVLGGSHEDRSEVMPIGLFNFQLAEKQVRKLVSIRIDGNGPTLKLDHFMHFAVRYAPVKKMIEHYYTGLFGIGKIQNMKWSNEIEALKYFEACIENKK